MIKKILKVIKILLWDVSQIKNLIKGVAITYEHKYVLSEYKFDTLVDVGANKGQFSLFAKALNRDLKVMAFEPLLGPQRKFRSVFKDAEGVILHPYAVGEFSGEETIHVSKQQDSSSLLSINELQGEMYPGTDESHSEVVTVKRLDEVITPSQVTGNTLLKIDVQGYELSVLKSLGVLINTINYIYVECSYLELYEEQPLVTEVLKYMFANNFELIGSYNSTFSNVGKAVQSDFLLKRVRS